jgi:hypothetical protein
LRIWADAVRTGKVDVDQIQLFQLVTTSSGPADDAAIVSLLQQDDQESRQSALAQMRRIASSKRNAQTLGVAYSEFDDLPAAQQEKLVSKIQISTNAPSFDDLDRRIRQHIVQGPPGKQARYSSDDGRFS